MSAPDMALLLRLKTAVWNPRGAPRHVVVSQQRSVAIWRTLCHNANLPPPG
jgi:hypothetical protein